MWENQKETADTDVKSYSEPSLASRNSKEEKVLNEKIYKHGKSVWRRDCTMSRPTTTAC